MLLQYRVAAFAGFTTQFFWGSIKLMVLGAFYANATQAPPLSFEAVVAYVWLGQALLALLPWNTDVEIRDKFRTGSVAYELLRPVDLYAFWFARTLAFRVAPTMLRMVPMLIVAFWVLPVVGLGEWALPLPPSAASAVAFAFSMTATICLATAITMVMHVTMYWTVDGRGITALMGGIVPIFSGMIVPLPLFPQWTQGFMQWQPFRGLADVPFRIYSGDIAAGDAWTEIVFQMGWAIVIIWMGYRLLEVARARLVVQGG